MTDTTNATKNAIPFPNVSTDKWMEILNLLTPESCKNLQSALNRFSQENGYDFSHDTTTSAPNCGLKCSNKLPDASELLLPQQTQTTIFDSPASSLTLPQFAPALLSSQVSPFNTQGDSLNTLTTPLVFAKIPLARPTELAPGSTTVPNVISKNAINGLDTLAAAALASTNSETTVTSTTSVAALQHQILAPGLDTRQSPTIGQTPKRLAATAATRAEEEAANRVDPLVPEGGVRFVDSKRSRFSIGSTVACELVLGDVSSAGGVDIVGSSLSTRNGGHLLLNGVACKPEEGIDGEREILLEVNPMLTTPCSTNGELRWLPPNFELKRAESTLDSLSGGINIRKTTDDNPSEDEAARKEKRRERNRVAAAKCRQNRQNQIERLQEDKKNLTKDQTVMEQSLTSLLNQRNQLLDNIRQHALDGCPEATNFLKVNFQELAPLSTTVALTGFPTTSTTTATTLKQDNVLPGLTWALQNNITNNNNGNANTASIRLNISPAGGKQMPFSSHIIQPVSTAQPPSRLAAPPEMVVSSGPVRPNTLVTKKGDPTFNNYPTSLLQLRSPNTPCQLAASADKKRISTPNAWVKTVFAQPSLPTPP